MCGRYVVDPEENIRQVAQIMEQIHALYGEDAPTGEIRPSQRAAVYDRSGLLCMHWGFTRRESNGLLINARAETVTEKVTFRQAFAESRCLIPATRYFEWQGGYTAHAGKQKYLIRSAQKMLLYLAGIYRREETQNRFVILTREAEGELGRIHNRMPVLVPAAYCRSYLTDRDAGGTLREILRICPQLVPSPVGVTQLSFLPDL